MVEVVTTHNTPPGRKPFAWSYSKLKNFESCPKRHWHIDVQKDFREEDSEQLEWGNLVHKALAARLAKGTPLPSGMEGFDHWCVRLTQEGNCLVEQQLAIDDKFMPVAWFAKTAWYRAVVDVLKVADIAAIAVDWKTGKIVEDSVQLALTAACVFAHYPAVQKIRTEFIWLKDDANTRADFTRQDVIHMWRGLWPRIQQLKNAYDTTSYPAKPNHLCRRWCPVRTCPHYGE